MLAPRQLGNSHIAGPLAGLRVGALFVRAASHIAFIPDYHDGQAPFGVWTPAKLLVPPQWADSSHPDYDVGSSAAVTCANRTSRFTDNPAAVRVPWLHRRHKRQSVGDQVQSLVAHRNDRRSDWRPPGRRGHAIRFLQRSLRSGYPASLPGGQSRKHPGLAGPESVIVSDRSSCGAASSSQLGQDVGDMDAHCLVRDEQLGRDLPIGPARGQ